MNVLCYTKKNKAEKFADIRQTFLSRILQQFAFPAKQQVYDKAKHLKFSKLLKHPTLPEILPPALLGKSFYNISWRAKSLNGSPENHVKMDHRDTAKLPQGELSVKNQRD